MMGYIAPVTNYQYSQYSERSVKRYDPFYFIPVSRVSPTVIRNPYQQKSIHDVQMKKNDKDRNSNSRNIQSSQIEATYSELTGKGMHFSECI